MTKPLEQVTDNVLADWQNRRLRLWMTSLRDRPEEFGSWSGLVRVRAEFFTDQWQPPRPELLDRLRELFGEEDSPPDSAINVLLPMAADALEADLLSKGVPKTVAQRARDLFTIDPPMAQWKI